MRLSIHCSFSTTALVALPGKGHVHPSPSRPLLLRLMDLTMSILSPSLSMPQICLFVYLFLEKEGVGDRERILRRLHTLHRAQLRA